VLGVVEHDQHLAALQGLAQGRVAADPGRRDLQRLRQRDEPGAASRPRSRVGASGRLPADGSGADGGGMGAPARVAPMNRQPRLGTVSIQRGSFGSLPSADRSSLTTVFTAPSLTARRPQTASSSSSFSSSSPARPARKTSSSKDLGGSSTAWPVRVRRALAGSSRKSPNDSG
jgi:hypothetical protein